MTTTKPDPTNDPKQPAGAPQPASRPADAKTGTPEADRLAADALIDEEDEESFPASDPPSWTLGKKDETSGTKRDKKGE